MITGVQNPSMALGAALNDVRFSNDCFLFRRKGLKMVVGSYYIPKNKKSKPQGEDSHFICLEKQTIGVADGVGGWDKKGIDAGEYARELMENCLWETRRKPTALLVPKHLLKEAFNRTNKEGTSTACVLTVKGDFLHAVNVGDSGFLVIRGGVAVYESPVQQHEFNWPFQLGKSSGADCPDSGLEITVPVEPGDVIVAGTDGLFDNVFLKDIESFVKEGIDNGVGADYLACALAKFAQEKALSNDFSPFALAARMDGVELNNTGGKNDDITVVVSYVVPWHWQMP